MWLWEGTGSKRLAVGIEREQRKEVPGPRKGRVVLFKDQVSDTDYI